MHCQRITSKCVSSISCWYKEANIGAPAFIFHFKSNSVKAFPLVVQQFPFSEFDLNIFDYVGRCHRLIFLLIILYLHSDILYHKKKKLTKMIYILSAVYDFNFYSNSVVIFSVLVIVKIEFNTVLGGYSTCSNFFCR